jgi:hypothetical protein
MQNSLVYGHEFEWLQTNSDQKANSTGSSQVATPIGAKVLLLYPDGIRLGDTTCDAAMVGGQQEGAGLFREVSSKSLNVPRPEYARARPVVVPPQDAARLVQSWEGTVVDVRRGKLIVRLRDLLHQQRPEERAEIPLEQLSEPDLPLVAPGAVFYWTMGYQVSPRGQRTLASDIRFRRDPPWSEADLRRAEARERELDELLGEPSAQ